MARSLGSGAFHGKRNREGCTFVDSYTARVSGTQRTERTPNVLNVRTEGVPRRGGLYVRSFGGSEMISLWTHNLTALRAIYSGRLTPKIWQAKVPWRLTYRKRAKMPWFLVVRCIHCGQYGLTSIKRTPAQRFRCQQWSINRDGSSRRCGQLVRFVVIPNMEERCGLTVWDTDVIQSDWMDKYARRPWRRMQRTPQRTHYDERRK